MGKLKSLKLSALIKENSNHLLGFVFIFCLGINSLFLFEFTPNDTLKINFNKKESKKVSVKVILAPPKQIKIEKVKKKTLGKKAKHKKLIQKKKIKKQVYTKKKKTQNQGQNTVLAQYVSRVRNSINTNKTYPKVAKRLKHQGTVKVELTIDGLGNLTRLEYLTKSNSIFLNGAVEKIFKKVKHFGALPKEIKERPLKLIIPIVFELI